MEGTFNLIEKKPLSEHVWYYRFHAPAIAAKYQAGQFVILRVSQNGERIPLTIVEANASEGWISVIFQTMGATTLALSYLPPGESVASLAGPLGRPTHVEQFGRCLCVGGGVGIAPLYPIIQALKKAGNQIISVLGARTEALLILEKEITGLSDEIYFATDDGSRGTKGFVSDVIKHLLAQGQRFDYSIIIGPPLMMRAASALTLENGIETYVSLNPLMIDGTGMCGGCRVQIGPEIKFACVEGPEFNAKGIDWQSMINRLGSYRSFEKHMCELERANHESESTKT